MFSYVYANLLISYSRVSEEGQKASYEVLREREREREKDRNKGRERESIMKVVQRKIREGNRGKRRKERIGESHKKVF